MATTTTIPTPATVPFPAQAVAGDERVVMRDIGWDGYQAILDIQGDRGRPQLVYLDGNLFLMSPARYHEWLNDRLGTFVREVVVGLDIPCVPSREQTFRREKDEAGVQPDDSFYLANHGPIAAKTGKQDIDLRFDPPPDLVIEVVNTHPATDAVEALRRFGVPEVWVADSEGLEILILRADGRYVASGTSLAFPFLTAGEIHGWATRPGMATMTQWIKEVRRWVQEELVPRARG